MKKAMPKQVATGVYQLGLGAVNVFFVEDDDGGLWLIDTGTQPGAERVGGGLRALGRAPKELRGGVATHLHGDHVGGLAAVKAHTGAEVWAQAEDAAALREGTRVRAPEPGPGLVRTVIARARGCPGARRPSPVAGPRAGAGLCTGQAASGASADGMSRLEWRRAWRHGWHHGQRPLGCHWWCRWRSHWSMPPALSLTRLVAMPWAQPPAAPPGVPLLGERHLPTNPSEAVRSRPPPGRSRR